MCKTLCLIGWKNMSIRSHFLHRVDDISDTMVRIEGCPVAMQESTSRSENPSMPYPDSGKKNELIHCGKLESD